MSHALASLNLEIIPETEKERMLRYKRLALAFSFPDEKLSAEYDRLFRAGEIWLYSTEYLAENEFQRANYLSDIMGFYRAFGLDIEAERPDALASELEFMYYLLFKEFYARQNHSTDKAEICRDAQMKFFNEHLFTAGVKVAQSVIARSAVPVGRQKSGFYREAAEEMLEFLNLEKANFEKS